MDPTLLKTLRAANPWLDDPGAFPQAAAHRIPAAYVPRVIDKNTDWPIPGKAHLVLGARQVGKSSFLWHWFLEQHRAPLLLSCEEPLIRAWCESPVLLQSDLAALAPPEMPVLLEEVQHLPNAGLLIKGLIDGGLPNPLFVTGSSAFHLREKTRESLAGRAVRISLHPFSLDEVSQDLRPSPPLLRASRRRELALRQAVWGGYPEVWLSDRPAEILARLLDAFVLRDASDLFRIQHLGAFRQLMRLVASQTGMLVNTAEWASLCGVSSGTIRQYLDLLADSHLIQIVSPFVGGRRAELTHRPKIYFCDNGLRNIVVDQLAPFGSRLDRGPLIEAWVAGELRKLLPPLRPGAELRFWRSKGGAEVDFVLERSAGLLGIEVKAAELKQPRLPRSARSFIDAYQPDRFLVINLGLDASEHIGSTEVRWITPGALPELL